MIKNIVFDLGNVLLDYKPHQFIADRYQGAELQARLYQEAFQCPEWLLLDRGTITQEEVVRILGERYPEDAEKIARLFNEWFEMLVPIEGTVAILKKLRAQGRHKLYALSNYHILAFEKVFSENDFFENFDGMIISAKEQVIKPEPGIYQRLIDKYGIVPEESIFIDDSQQNLKGAQAFGIKTIQFTSPEELVVSLREFGVEV